MCDGFRKHYIYRKVPVFSASGGSKPPALPLATNFSEKQTYLTICILRCLFFVLYFSPAVGQGFISCRILITVIFPFVRRVSETLYLPKSTVLSVFGGSKPPALPLTTNFFRETNFRREQAALPLATFFQNLSPLHLKQTYLLAFGQIAQTAAFFKRIKKR